MLRKLAAGAAMTLLVPILVLAAAIGSVSGGSANGAPVAAAAFCSQEATSSPAPSEAPAVAATRRGHTRPCQDGELEAMVLSNPRIELSSLAAGDVAAGRIDPRVLEVLMVL